jgi:hypothetical protein
MSLISDSDLLVIKIVDEQPQDYPLTYSNFRLIHPQTSFPELPNNSFLVDFGYYKFQYINKPAPQQFVNISEGPIVLDEELDAWTNSWISTPFTEQEMEQATQRQYTVVRNNRDQKLYACDWTQLPDVQLSAEQVETWRTYRQALRDYMTLVTDPFNPPPFPTKST